MVAEIRQIDAGLPGRGTRNAEQAAQDKKGHQDREGHRCRDPKLGPSNWEEGGDDSSSVYT